MRTLGLLLALVIGIPVVVYVIHGVSGTIEQRHLDDDATADLVAGLPDAEDAVRSKRARAIAATAGRRAPTHSWAEVVCGFSSNDAGWIVQDYVQECRVHSVDLIPLATSPGGQCDYRPGTYQGGYTVRTVSREGLLAPDAGVGCPDVLRAPSYETSVLLAGERPTSRTLGAAPGWLVLEVTTEASSTVLGCSPWGLIFCGNPLDHPVLDRDAVRSVRRS